MQKSKLFLAGIFTLTLLGCTSTSQEQQPPASGFLPNYTLLKPIPSPEGTHIYLYRDPTVQKGDYSSVLIEPVVLYQTATANGVTEAQIATARDNLNQGIQKIVSQKASIATAPGKGVARLDVAITGATVEGEGFKPWNIIPISAAVTLASMATDLNSKDPIMMVELKLTDSMTGKLLLESVSMISGESFRDRAKTSEEFTKLAETWIRDGLHYSLLQS